MNLCRYAVTAPSPEWPCASGAVVQVNEPLGHLLLTGRDNSQVQLAADAVALFPNGHVVAALGSGDSGVHAAGAGADDQQLLGLVGGIEGEVILTANQGVDVALADGVLLLTLFHLLILLE